MRKLSLVSAGKCMALPLAFAAALLGGCKPSTDTSAKPSKTLQVDNKAVVVEQAKAAEPTEADADAALQQQLLQALKPQSDGSDRFLLADPVIKAYADAGYIKAKPDARLDYSDYFLLQKPATLLGHQLMVIDNEYMQEYIGCCVSHGLAVTVKLLPGGEDLQAFAAANQCAFSPDSEEYLPERDAGLAPAPVGTYARVSCKERDVPLED